MPRYFSDELLRRLRNEIDWPSLLQQLRWPHKRREGQLAFLCPRCQEYRSAVKASTMRYSSDDTPNHPYRSGSAATITGSSVF